MPLPTGVRWRQRPRGLPTPLHSLLLVSCVLVLPACAPGEPAPEASSSASATPGDAPPEVSGDPSATVGSSTSNEQDAPPTAQAEEGRSTANSSIGDAFTAASDIAEQAAYHLAGHVTGEPASGRSRMSPQASRDNDALVAPRARTPEPGYTYGAEQALIDAVLQGGYPTDPSEPGYVQVSGPQAVVTVVPPSGSRERASVCFDSSQRMFYVVEGLRCLPPGNA